ncbi:hypothetical protein A7K99_15155 [Tatumella citrea]|uniref:Uncharacterized protein n=1 Tax=Tatumella citrea TaxID=53336 RepID=A0A1Y0LLR2_TATCI|nr:hypothetical protein A7K98_15170 [Tatumella citrea]ARU99011.1 hypothetical protein A7K99_15155 [Tatumella citrea]
MIVNPAGSGAITDHIQTRGSYCRRLFACFIFLLIAGQGSFQQQLLTLISGSFTITTWLICH